MERKARGTCTWKKRACFKIDVNICLRTIQIENTPDCYMFVYIHMGSTFHPDLTRLECFRVGQAQGLHAPAHGTMCFELYNDFPRLFILFLSDVARCCDDFVSIMSVFDHTCRSMILLLLLLF